MKICNIFPCSLQHYIFSRRVVVLLIRLFYLFICLFIYLFIYLFEAGRNIEYLVPVKFTDNLFALNQRVILLSSQFIYKKIHLRLCLKEIYWYQNLFALNQRTISLSSQLISKKDHLRLFLK